ncbi:nucleotidyltransferase [Candidatus Woesearchaeota archaeon]|nr:nucleotidyltransferase [Candidatus Woesearchaeota archaeon]
MINIEQQNELFKLIGEILKDKLECYVIGGSAMMYYGMKGNTKDIDLVFEHEKDREKIIQVLKNLGYNERGIKVVSIIYPKKKNTPILLERDDSRVDLFVNKIISTVLSNSMKNRINSIYEYGNFTIKVLAPEDLIITKCATERAGDRLDAVEIMKRAKIDWEVIIKESIFQAEVTPYLFPVFLFDFLYELKEDLKAEVPKKVLDEIRKISEDMLEKKLKGKKKIKTF